MHPLALLLQLLLLLLLLGPLLLLLLLLLLLPVLLPVLLLLQHPGSVIVLVPGSTATGSTNVQLAIVHQPLARPLIKSLTI